MYDCIIFHVFILNFSILNTTGMSHLKKNYGFISFRAGSVMSTWTNMKYFVYFCSTLFCIFETYLNPLSGRPVPQYKSVVSSYQTYILDLLLKKFSSFSDKTSLMPYSTGVCYVLTQSAAEVKKSDLPSSGIYVYPYIVTPTTVRGEDGSDLPSGGKLRKSNSTGATADMYAFRPTLGGVIGLIPFLPIEINIPNVISSMMTFFNWLTNRRPYQHSTPRVYFLLRNHHGYRMQPLNVWPTLSVSPDVNQPSHSALTGRIVHPAYNAPAA